MSTEYDGEPLDLGWKSYIGSDNGETVEASNNGEQQGNTSTMYWPEGLPESAFEHDASGLQKEIIENAVQFHGENDGHIANMVGCTKRHVEKVKSKVAMFVEPGSVSFDIPETPNKNGLTEPLLDHEECRFEADSWAELLDEPETETDSGEKPVDIKEIGDRYYDGEDPESIARDFAITPKQVTGYLGQYNKDHSQDEISGGNKLANFESLRDRFPDHYVEIFNRLAAGQEIDYVAEQVGKSDATVRRVICKSACYVDPEKLPFDAPEEPDMWALSQEDKEALRNRRENGESVEDQAEQTELPADSGESEENEQKESEENGSDKARFSARVDKSVKEWLDAAADEHQLNRSQVIEKLVSGDINVAENDHQAEIELKESRIEKLNRKLNMVREEKERLATKVEAQDRIITAKDDHITSLESVVNEEEEEQQAGSGSVFGRIWSALSG